MNSQAASISAWYTFLDCPSIVAALISERHGPAKRSAAFRKIAARRSHGKASHSALAFWAASAAAFSSDAPAK